MRQSIHRKTAADEAITMKTINDKMGFTLMELMMSLGILVVGLAMIATAFPSAMMETKHSVADTTATMISENAAAICRVKISHDADKGSVGGTLANATALINSTAHTGDLTYPVARGDHVSAPDDWIQIPPGGTWFPSTRYGWLLAARQPTDNNTNDYQLVIVPYRKFLPEHSAPTFTNVRTDGSKITFGNKSIGSPVICKADGTFAYVVDSAGTLSHPITAGNALTVGLDGRESPAIGCYIVRTAVAP